MKTFTKMVFWTSKCVVTKLKNIREWDNSNFPPSSTYWATAIFDLRHQKLTPHYWVETPGDIHACGCQSFGLISNNINMPSCCVYDWKGVKRFLNSKRLWGYFRNTGGTCWLRTIRRPDWTEDQTRNGRVYGAHFISGKLSWPFGLT